MGVLHDYFRAPDGAAAARVLDRPGGPMGGAVRDAPRFDGIDAKGVDPGVVFGRLVAIIRQVPWDVDLIRCTRVWPDGPAPDADAYLDLPEGSPWVTGPWIEEIAVDVRDTLADADDARVSEIAEQWAQTEELAWFGSPEVAPLKLLVAQFVQLARRARTADEQLYCWSSL